MGIPSELLYDLMAVMKHSLQAADKSEKAIAEAEEVGDRELAVRLREIREASAGQAERLRALLGDELTRPPPALDVVEEASIESFPASDSPAY